MTWTAYRTSALKQLASRLTADTTTSASGERNRCTHTPALSSMRYSTVTDTPPRVHSGRRSGK